MLLQMEIIDKESLLFIDQLCAYSRSAVERGLKVVYVHFVDAGDVFDQDFAGVLWKVTGHVLPYEATLLGE